MKKLLAITLVLGLAAAANAVTVTPSALECPVGESITIVVSDPDGLNYSGYFELTDEVAASVVGADSGPGVRGSLGKLDDPATVAWPGTWYFVAAGPVGAGPLAGADHFVFTYTALDDNSLVTINTYQEDWATPLVPSFAIQNTPEPMTLGLLGLGGLFLRRRK